MRLRLCFRISQCVCTRIFFLFLFREHHESLFLSFGKHSLTFGPILNPCRFCLSSLWKLMWMIPSPSPSWGPSGRGKGDLLFILKKSLLSFCFLNKWSSWQSLVSITSCCQSAWSFPFWGSHFRRLHYPSFWRLCPYSCRTQFDAEWSKWVEVMRAAGAALTPQTQPDQQQKISFVNLEAVMNSSWFCLILIYKLHLRKWPFSYL